MARYKAVIIGAGPRAYSHADAYRHIENARLGACADLSEERRDKIAERYGITVYDDAAKMLETEKPDLVHIVTPPSIRASLMRLVSDHGVPACTVEKPIAVGANDWRELCELERRSATKFAVCHQFRWHPDLARCREALASGALGEILMLDATAGMNITNQGTHTLHYANSLNGDIDVTTVFGAAAGWDYGDASHPGPESTVGAIRFENSVRMLWNTGPTAPRVGDPTTTWQHVRVAAYTTRGRVLWEEFGRWEIVGPTGMECGDYGGMERWSAMNCFSQAEFHKAMLRWIDDDDAPAGTNLKRSLHEWKTVLALYASAKGKGPVEMASFEPSEEDVRMEKA